ncbi:hypothetical protein MMC24_004300 [Lignoscripta atroalba]|nr:hypothetical protein [Lignoscripta atroalba]
MQHDDFLTRAEKSQLQPLASRSRKASPLLPAIELKQRTRASENTDYDGNAVPPRLSPPPNIERPGSALHSGDFTESSSSTTGAGHDPPPGSNHPLRESTPGPLGTSPTTPWYTPAFSALNSFQSDGRFPPAEASPPERDRRPIRNRAPSFGTFSSSYVLKQPTSPLVQQSNNTDLDFSPVGISTSPGKSNRRHTLPPQALQFMQSSPIGHLPTLSELGRKPPSVRRDGTFPFQTHQVRRSLTSNWSLQASGPPQTPAFLRSRRPSAASEASPIQHASMVGSYEESILRGRMSTGPSKPLDFTAQIGVLGKGIYKPKYPAHVTVPFPAVFYSWSSGAGTSPFVFDAEPSPYVGHIDLEHSLPPSQPKESRRRHRDAPVPDDIDASGDPDSPHEHYGEATNITSKKREKRKRRSTSPKAPPGGSYRIPQQGQLQIMIKNPNKTAVKLFLVPYDLQGMEPGTKTFIRQKCYSAGPIFENPLTSKSFPDHGDCSAGDALNAKTKQTLRYLIHLNICCPSKGRFFLYQHVRVVFANRVPDNKEKLQNRIQLPEPRYSAYKPNREPLSDPTSNAGAKHTAETVQRRRSYGFHTGFSQGTYDSIDGLKSQAFTGGISFPCNHGTPAPPIPPFPYSFIDGGNELARGLTLEPEPEQDGLADEPMDLDKSSRPTSSGLQSPLSDKTNRIANNLSSSYRSSSSHSSDSYTKLSRGDAGYGGIFGRPGTPEPGEGLLARRLRGLGVQKEAKNTDI